MGHNIPFFIIHFTGSISFLFGKLCCCCCCCRFFFLDISNIKIYGKIKGKYKYLEVSKLKFMGCGWDIKYNCLAAIQEQGHVLLFCCIDR